MGLATRRKLVQLLARVPKGERIKTLARRDAELKKFMNDRRLPPAEVFRFLARWRAEDKTLIRNERRRALYRQRRAQAVAR